MLYQVYELYIKSYLEWLFKCLKILKVTECIARAKTLSLGPGGKIKGPALSTSNSINSSMNHLRILEHQQTNHHSTHHSTASSLTHCSSKFPKLQTTQKYNKGLKTLKSSDGNNGWEWVTLFIYNKWGDGVLEGSSKKHRTLYYKIYGSIVIMMNMGKKILMVGLVGFHQVDSLAFPLIYNSVNL